MTRVPILLLGAGGHARASIDVIEQEGRFQIAGLIGTRDEVGMRVSDYEVLGTEDDLPALLARYATALVVVGQIKSPAVRIRLFEAALKCRAAMPAIVSPRAYVSPRATIGDGTLVLHGAVVNAGARVGRNCIVNTKSLIEHDAAVGDHCHVATTAVINGGAAVGARCFIGSGAHIRQGVAIGDDCIVGMGQSVFTDCGPGTRVPSPRTIA